MSRKKDSQTPRADSRIKNNRGMLSPKQNQNVFERVELDQTTKSKGKHQHLNSTMPEYSQTMNTTKPFN